MFLVVLELYSFFTKLRKIKLTKIQLENLAHASAQIKVMDSEQKEVELQKLQKSQPNLLGSILVLESLGRSYNEMEVLLELLILTFLALEHGEQKIESVSNELQEQELRRYSDYINYIDGLPEKKQEAAMSEYLDSHSEKYLLAFAMGEMNDAGFPYIEEESASYLMSCGVNLVNCISAARLAL